MYHIVLSNFSKRASPDSTLNMSHGQEEKGREEKRAFPRFPRLSAVLFVFDSMALFQPLALTAVSVVPGLFAFFRVLSSARG
jgi:hypothetical protein